jgi:endonuclease/exonuclease/phosphatase family metal-dependent hydrolase
MHLLIWNVELGRGTAAALRLADQLTADAVFLQEAFTVEHWHGPVCTGQVHGQDWGSAVLVRDGTLEPVNIPGYTGWVVGARWLPRQATPPKHVYLFSVHSPTSTDAEPRRSYVTEARQIVRTICATVPIGAPLIIAGDFNFTSFGERLPDEPLVNTKPELAALKEFRELNLSVAWRDTHPKLPLPQTIRWKKAPATPYHCDGFLLRHIEMANAQCEVLVSESVTGQSDHNPVLLRVE